MYEPVLTDEKLDLYNVYEVHKNYRILVMAVNVPLQVAEEICHILNNFEPVILKTRRFRSKQNLIKYWNATKSEQAMRYLQRNYESMFDREKE